MKTGKKSINRTFLVIFILIIIFGVVISVNYFILSPKPIFSKDKSGILVLKIDGDKQDSLQNHYVNSLNKELYDLEISVKSLNSAVTMQTGIKQAYKQTREIGKENNAFLVIWGEQIEPNKFRPRLTVVHDSTYSTSKDTPIMTNQKVNEIDLPVDIIPQSKILKNFVKGYFLFTQQQYSESIPYFERSLQSVDLDKAESINLLLYLGNCHFELFKNDNAQSELDLTLKYLNQVIEINPKNSIVYFNRANVNFTQKNFNKALSDYDKAIKIDQGYSSYYNNRGNIYFLKEKYDLALSDYNHAIELNSKYTDAYFNRGSVNYKQTQYDSALSDFTSAVKINPKLESAFVNRGFIYFLQEQFDLALSDFDSAIKINPIYIEAYKKRATLYEENGQIQKALSDRTKIIELQPNDYFSYIDRGLIYTNEKKFDQAISDYNKSIKLNSKLADAYYCKAFTFHINGKLKEAITAYKKFIQYSSPKDIENVKSAKQSIKELKKLLNK